MKRKPGKFIAGITTLVALIFGTMSALPAHAGSNGQQLAIKGDNPNIAAVLIDGYNQAVIGRLSASGTT
jgi:hypothetical protein